MSLQKIQRQLKAPKSQYNKFGGYYYRNQEDILEALKPVLAEYQYSLVINDTVEEVAGRVYIKAQVNLYDADMQLVTYSIAYAREPSERKGMDPAQVSGATSSYARKYALNGLFCIDDTKDADNDKPQNGNNGSNQEKSISDSQASQIYDMINQYSLSESGFLRYMGVDEVSKIPVKDFNKAMEALNKKAKAAANA